MSKYLQPPDYPIYGVSPEDWQVIQASNVIDGHLQRSEGLIYEDSGSGLVMSNTQAPIVERREMPLRQPFILSRNPVVSVSAVRWFDGASWHTVSTNNLTFFDHQVYLPNVPFNALVEVTYVAGYLQAELPAAVKQACANIVYALINTPEVTGNVTNMKSGDTSITWQGTSLLDADSITLLSGWKRDFA